MSSFTYDESEHSTSILQTQPTTAIADSFPGMEAMQPVAPQRQAAAPVQLKNPPKWLKRPVGANFGFGGKLVTFQAVKAPANQQVGMVVYPTFWAYNSYTVYRIHPLSLDRMHQSQIQ